jgi:hypothetical protein
LAERLIERNQVLNRLKIRRTGGHFGLALIAPGFQRLLGWPVDSWKKDTGGF